MAGQESSSAPSNTAPPRMAQSRPFSFRARSWPSALATVMEGRLQILFSGERTHRIIREAERLERNQSTRAPFESVHGGFFLRKKPLGSIAFGVQLLWFRSTA